MNDRSVPDPSDRINTVAMLGQAYSLLGFQIVEGVVGTGIPIKPRYSAVFAQLGPEGARITALARGANMTPQAMGELVDELEQLGYVTRTPDPSDRRAKLVMLTALGQQTEQAAFETIGEIETRLDALLGPEGRAQLRSLLGRIVAQG